MVIDFRLASIAFRYSWLLAAARLSSALIAGLAWRINKCPKRTSVKSSPPPKPVSCPCLCFILRFSIRLHRVFCCHVKKRKFRAWRSCSSLASPFFHHHYRLRHFSLFSLYFSLSLPLPLSLLHTSFLISTFNLFLTHSSPQPHIPAVYIFSICSSLTSLLVLWRVTSVTPPPPLRCHQ